MSKEEIEAVMWEHINAGGSGDMDKILSHYTDESIIIAPQGILQGLDTLPPFFTAWIESVTPELGATFEITHQHIRGDVAYIVWKMADYVPFATDTYIIRDGKIMIQTFAPYLPNG
jgi:ketosteroid isomerase-like protein